jgi:sugar phosphate isomerase/epimerase
MGSTLAVQICSVPDAVAADLSGTLARLAEIGYTQVELYGFVDRAQEFSDALAANGLTAPSGHAPLLQMKDPRPAFDAAAAVGVTTFIDPLHPRQHWTSLVDVRATADRMNVLGAIAEDYGMVFGYHNHWWEIEARHGGRTLLEHLADELDPKIVLEIDTFWAQVGGVSAPDLLTTLGKRVQLLHIKDGAIQRQPLAQEPVGQGAMDIPGVLRAAPHVTRIVEFDAYDGDLFVALQESFRYMTTLELENT